jgi:hypothetical protein
MDRNTKKLLKQLESDKPKERYQAVLELGKTGDTDLIDPLDRVANLDDHPKVRELASKAVNTLEILQKRRLGREHIAQEIKVEGEDAGVEWPELMKEKMMEERRLTAAQDYEEFNYIESKKKELDRKKAKAAELEAQRQAEIAKQRARARRFRMALWVLLAFAVVGLFVLAWYITSVESPPTTREAALFDLQEWTREQQAAVIAFETEFQKDPLECATLQSIALPSGPKWTELLTISELAREPQEGILNSLADDMNRIDETLLGGLEPVLNDLSRTNNRLFDISLSVNASCSAGLDEVPQAAWADLAQVEGYIAQAQRSAVNAASEIENELLSLQVAE